MDLKRKIYDRLLEWKGKSNGSTAMLIDGARRVGKSWLCKQFAEHEYRSHSSLDKFRTKFSSKLGKSYILYTKDVMVKDGIIHLPVYMAMFL